MASSIYEIMILYQAPNHTPWHSVFITYISTHTYTHTHAHTHTYTHAHTHAHTHTHTQNSVVCSLPHPSTATSPCTKERADPYTSRYCGGCVFYCRDKCLCTTSDVIEPVLCRISVDPKAFHSLLDLMADFKKELSATLLKEQYSNVQNGNPGQQDGNPRQADQETQSACADIIAATEEYLSEAIRPISKVLQ